MHACFVYGSVAFQTANMSISVVINTYNSAAHLEKVLDCVKDFNEVVVCDMESTDNTTEIARRKGARVTTFPRGKHRSCDPARNFAISQARCDWVLVVDDDELVPSELREYLYRYIHSAHPADALYIPKANFILHKLRKDNYPDYSLRFFNQEKVEWPAEANSHPTIDGTIDKIPAHRKDLAIVNIPNRVEEMLEKINNHSSADYNQLMPYKVTMFSLTVVPFFHFCRVYFVRGAWRFGIPGLIAAVNDSVYRFYRQAKLYESHRLGKIEQKFKERQESFKKRKKR